MPPDDAAPLGQIHPAKLPAVDVRSPDSDHNGPEGKAGAATGRSRSGNMPEVKEKVARKRFFTKRKAAGEERQFMPAALEILETPASPAGRAIAYTIIAMFALAIAWACIGKIDIVAVANGRVVPLGGTKLVQSSAIASVRAIHVRNGQHVRAGELLVELDATESEVDIDNLKHQRAEAGIEASRLDAFIAAVRGQAVSYGPPSGGVDTAIVEMHRNRLQSDLASFAAEMGALKAEASRRTAEIATISAEVAKASELKPLLLDREATVRELMEQGHTPKTVWQQVKAQLIEVKHDLNVKSSRKVEAESSLRSAEQKIDALIAQTLQKAYESLAQAKERLVRSELALRKAYKREERQKLRAPVAGRVHRLTARTVGGVVRPVEPILMIVPDEAQLEIHAQVLNRDKGVVFEGQSAEVKLEAFDFTRYGTLDGEVVSISDDALESEQFGLVYETRVKLKEQSVSVEGRDAPLTPGMMVSVEIKIGQRRVIDYLLSPLKRYRDEAIRER